MDQWPSSEDTSTSPNHHNVHSNCIHKKPDQAVKRGRQALSIADRAPAIIPFTISNLSLQLQI